MKIFLDTANIDEIREANALGVLDGVTTNPTLISKERQRGSFTEIVRAICTEVHGPVSLEVVSTETAGMVEEGRRLAKIAGNVVVKIPMIPDGLKAVRLLREEGINVNVTLIFSPSQALLAAKAGANYVSPFIGRIDDASQVGMEIIRQIGTIFFNYDFPTELIVASIRHPIHVVEAAMEGADIATMPAEVFRKLLHHPLTDVGLRNFLKDWEKVRPE